MKHSVFGLAVALALTLLPGCSDQGICRNLETKTALAIQRVNEAKNAGELARDEYKNAIIDYNEFKRIFDIQNELTEEASSAMRELRSECGRYFFIHGQLVRE